MSKDDEHDGQDDEEGSDHDIDYGLTVYNYQNYMYNVDIHLLMSTDNY